MTRSPRRLREQVRDTVSDLPIQAARLAVMGVGRALLLTDRVRKDYREARESGLSPVLGRLKNDAENLTGMVVGKVAGNGQAPETPKSRPATDSEISVGKPKTSGTSRPTSRTRPATAPPSRPSTTSRPKPAAAKPTPKPAPKPSAEPAAKPAPKPAAKAKPAAVEKPSASAKPKPADTKPAPKPAPKPKPAEAKTTPKRTEAKTKTTPKPVEAKTTPKSVEAKTPAKPATAKTTPAKTTPKPAEAKTPAKPAEAKTTARVKAPVDLPVSGYDEATLASVRARLRGLDARQVGELRDYERANAARADFLRMYENRIAKIRGER